MFDPYMQSGTSTDAAAGSARAGTSADARGLPPSWAAGSTAQPVGEDDRGCSNTEGNSPWPIGRWAGRDNALHGVLS